MAVDLFAVLILVVLNYYFFFQLRYSYYTSLCHICHFSKFLCISFPEMAEKFLKLLLDNLSSLVKGEIGLIMGVDKQMKKLSSTITAVQAVLEDA